MNKAELIEYLNTRALNNAERSYDERSRTHIIFCLEVGKFGTRGVGAFADDAFADFREHLASELAAASEDQLNGWFEKIKAGTTATAVPIPTTTTSTKKQIGLYTTGNQLHDSLAAAAASAQCGQSELASQLIEHEYGVLNAAAFSMPSENVRKIVKASDSQCAAGDRVQWAVRVPSRLFSRIALFAKQFDLTVPQVCIHLLVAGLEQRAKLEPAKELSPVECAR